MPKLETRVTVEISPVELAKLCADLDSIEAAAFWNALAEEVGKWPGPAALPMQLRYVTDHPELSIQARALMQMIGDYSHAPGIY